MTSPRRVRHAVLLSLLAAGVTACGTTVSGTVASTSSAGDSTLGGAAAQTATGRGAAPGAANLSLGGTAVSRGAQTGPVAVAPGSSNTSSGTVAVVAGPSVPASTANGPDGPGLTATTINVAAEDEPDAGAADAALGVASANPGDLRGDQLAVFNYLNHHGGIAGRKILPIWYTVRSSNSAATSYEQMCQTWTQDHKVFIIGSEAPELNQCAANARVVDLDSGSIVQQTTELLHRYPMVVNLTGLTIDRAMSVTIRGLARQGYFPSGAKVGVATWDDSLYHEGISTRALPALAAMGIRNVPVEYVAVPESYGDLGATSASVGNAVLKFASLGIDHVILFDGTAGINQAGVLVLEWMQQANSQRYYPRYGLNTTSGFNAAASDYPQRELVNSVGVDWMPPLSMNADQYAKYQQSPNGKLCLKIMAAAGLKQSTGSAQASQLAICDTFFFLKQALGSVKGALNQETAMAAINAMGASYRSATTFGIDISASRHDGATLVRDMAYEQNCQCFAYTSGAYDTGG